ncbi:MAG: hypothetical protein FJW69_10615, partial [Actinobacteria bacterium]|nr:hypothetical protein [Actinomycetota bacterium]
MKATKRNNIMGCLNFASRKSKSGHAAMLFMAAIFFLFFGLTAVKGGEEEAIVKKEADGRYRVNASFYTAHIDATGSFRSLNVGGTEFIESGTTLNWNNQTTTWPGTACGRMFVTGWPLKLHALSKVAAIDDITLKAEGDQWWVEYRFLPDAIEYTVGGQPGGIPYDGYPKVFFCWNLSRDLSRACAPES